MGQRSTQAREQYLSSSTACSYLQVWRCCVYVSCIHPEFRCKCIVFGYVYVCMMCMCVYVCVFVCCKT